MQSEFETSWSEKARCKGADTELFYPPRDKQLYSVIAAKAKAYCLGESGTAHCPVRAECLWSAIEKEEQHGIWGGMSHRERNALVRKWHRQYRKNMTLKEYVFSLEQNKYGNK
jgi:WhiB family redox-sensing transcriptional regulator